MHTESQEAVLSQVPRMALATAMPEHADRPRGGIRQPTQYAEQYYEAEWVTPNSDGWALWSPPTSSDRPVYGRTVLAVPNGDGWALCDDVDDLDSANTAAQTF